LLQVCTGQSYVPISKIGNTLAGRNEIIDFTTRFARDAENSEMGYFHFSLFAEMIKREKLQPFGHGTSFKTSWPAAQRSNGNAAQRLWFSSVPLSGTDEREN